MIQKINHLVETVLQGLVSGADVECVQRIPYHGGGGLASSPLFCLKLDVFFRGSIPAYPGRLEAFPSLQYLETSLTKEKDRFFLEQTPIHLDYKEVPRINQELAGLEHRGMSLGHADPAAPENRLVTEREPVAGFTRFLE